MTANVDPAREASFPKANGARVNSFGIVDINVTLFLFCFMKRDNIKTNQKGRFKCAYRTDGGWR